MSVRTDGPLAFRPVVWPYIAEHLRACGGECPSGVLAAAVADRFLDLTRADVEQIINAEVIAARLELIPTIRKKA